MLIEKELDLEKMTRHRARVRRGDGAKIPLMLFCQETKKLTEVSLNHGLTLFNYFLGYHLLLILIGVYIRRYLKYQILLLLEFR